PAGLAEGRDCITGLFLPEESPPQTVVPPGLVRLQAKQVPKGRLHLGELPLGLQRPPEGMMRQDMSGLEPDYLAQSRFRLGELPLFAEDFSQRHECLYVVRLQADDVLK